MRDNSKYIISHSYTKISQTGTQFPMHPLKTICTVKMAWHNRGKRSGTQWVNVHLISMAHIKFQSRLNLEKKDDIFCKHELKVRKVYLRNQVKYLIINNT